MMIDFNEIIRHFWGKALHAIDSWEEAAVDKKGITAILNKNLATREADVREWLRRYAVLQGLTTTQRGLVAHAVLTWADGRNLGGDLDTPEALAEAHQELEETCQDSIMNLPHAKKRKFVSLAAKALWLCYPKSVPLYDRNTKSALHVIAKLEEGINLSTDTEPEYKQFVHVWKQLYERHRATIESLDIGSHCRMRVFDAVLWLIGKEAYRAN